jgi:hypothetical protein
MRKLILLTVGSFLWRWMQRRLLGRARRRPPGMR